MVNKCSVPRCNGNYENGPKLPVYRFPQDAELLRKWISAIPRQDFKPTPNSRVSSGMISMYCKLYFCVFILMYFRLLLFSESNLYTDCNFQSAYCKHYQTCFHSETTMNYCCIYNKNV